MLTRRIFLTCLLMLGILSLSAQWRLGVKNHLSEKYNTRVLLDFMASTDRNKTFLVEVSFREAESHRVILSREIKLTASGSKLFELLFQVPEGPAYQVDVDVLDLDLNERQLISATSLYRVSRQREVRVSDIYLSYQADPKQAFAEPLLLQTLDPDQKILHYFLELEAPDYDVLTFRAELYEKQPEADQQAVSFLVSIDQTRRVVYVPSRGKVVFQDSLVIADLPTGEYQIDVRIYNDEQRLAAKTESFSIGSDLKKWIFTHIEEAFQMMVYVMPARRIDSLLEVERDTFVRREAFEGIWTQFYKEKSEEQMERYFRKVFVANERYPERGSGGEDIPGWETDRGRIFILYGEPREKSIEINGKSYLRWTYSRWSLSFIFEERNQRYELVE